MAYTLTIYFGLANPDAGNYRIKYWPVSNPSSITTVFSASSPVVVPGLSECAYDGTVESACQGNNYSAPQSFSITNCPGGSISYTPCALVSSNGLTPSNIYLAPGVTDIAPGVQLYDSNGNIITTVTQISDTSGMVYNVDSSGVVTTSTNQMC